MNVYVLTWQDGNPKNQIINGVYGIFSTLEKAMKCACEHVTKEEDFIFDTDYSDTMFHYFTKNGTWTIEQLELDSTGF